MRYIGNKARRDAGGGVARHFEGTRAALTDLPAGFPVLRFLHPRRATPQYARNRRVSIGSSQDLLAGGEQRRGGAPSLRGTTSLWHGLSAAGYRRALLWMQNAGPPKPVPGQVHMG